MIAGIIFDLDGTITRPYLDFARIRQEVSADDSPVWEHILSLPPLERARAEAVLLRYEMEAASCAQLNLGAGELLDWLEAKSIKTALLTRNCRKSVQTILERFNLAFDCIVTREDAPVKPSPEPVLLIARELDIPPERLLIVGDYHFDILAGKAAGTRTCYLTNGRTKRQRITCDYVISNLLELRRLVEQ